MATGESLRISLNGITANNLIKLFKRKDKMAAKKKGATKTK